MNNTNTYRKGRKLLKYSFLILFLSLSPYIYAQENLAERITISFSNITLSEAIQKIEDYGNYTFFYDANKTNLQQRTTVNAQNASIEELVRMLLKDTDLTFTITNRQIALIPRTAQATVAYKRITGTVTDLNGEPVIGANVVEKGTTNGAITDTDGRFSLSVPENASLQISYIGYNAQTLSVRNQTNFSIALKEDSQALEEVVVVGYGTRKKSSLTTAVASLNGDELSSQSSSDLRKSLQGMVPGLTILDNGGDPGSFNMQMQIRGISSPNGSAPLILVDGQVHPSLNGLDANTIASVSVLKDAASTAIYGSRGANGIILIITKKGEKGRLKVNYEGSIGWQSATALPQFMDTEQFLNYRNDLAYFEKQRNPTSTLPTYTQEEIQDYLKNMKTDPVNHRAASYDMEDLYRPNVPQTKHSLTVNGGGDFARSLFNISYSNQEGLIRKRTYERIGLRSNTDFNFSKNLTGYANLYYEHSIRQRQASGHAEYEIVQGIHNPTAKWGLGGAPFYDEEGNYIPNAARRRNAMLLTDLNYTGLHRTNADFGAVDIGLDWEPMEGLKISGSYAYQKTWQKEDKNVPKWKLDFQEYVTNSLTYNNQHTSRATLNGLITYVKSFGNHNLNLLAGYSTEEFSNEQNEMYGQDFFNNEIRNIGSGSQENFTLSNSLNEWGLRSYFGRIAYNYADRYYAEGSMRSDGSSRFPKGNRYSQFPGVSVGWRISNEKIWESLQTLIPNLKIRYSYGQTGSHDGIGNYSYIPQLTVGQYYDFASGPNGEYAVNTVRQTNLASSELSWEKVIQNNYGLDVAFIANKLNLTFDYFTKVTNDVLLDLAIPKIIGLNPAKTNAGKVENKGWELDISWRDAIGDFSYSGSFAIAHVKNKLVDYAGLGITQINDMYYRWEGSPLFAIRGYKVIGIIQTEAEAAAVPKIDAYASQVAPGDYIYEDVNKDGKIDWDNDAQYLGSRTPEYTYNLRLSAAWKGFDLTMLWNGVAKAETYLAGYLGEGGAYNNAPVSTFVLNNYWKKEGDTNVHFGRPLFRESNNLMERGYSSAFVWDASFLRLRSLIVGYSLPESITKRIRINRVRFFFDGNNLLTFSSFMSNWGLDPEDVPVSGAGFDGGASNTKRHIHPPQLKSYNIGVNIQ
ncbi:MAG: TonB-dependent receptor, partial [Tannerellaceae bacterium]|nr:TonB-dependent receptor [Tannerellaceae bacterium]